MKYKLFSFESFFSKKILQKAKTFPEISKNIYLQNI